jgi:hypothetical protein
MANEVQANPTGHAPFIKGFLYHSKLPKGDYTQCHRER